MPLEIWTFLLGAGSFLVLVAGVHWTVGGDRVQASPGGPLVIAGGVVWRRVPLGNRYRVHGRHRAG
ncbi:hypothetical protein NS506_00736 [Nocardia seriolae]|uniref:Uncharacterized protein n=1 Tax=Nocardia seriolae TaxID=37332 RepID=A0ABC8AKS7_9NOCA|nr:hypothetical protein NS506_00736 [Nocardia seriolae]GAM48270.1 hypothetical protein NS07_v2contig00069-0016 [Nocardia seriolae]